MYHLIGLKIAYCAYTFFFRIGFKDKEKCLCSFVLYNIRWLWQQWRSRVTSLCALKWLFCVMQCLFNNRCYVRLNFKLQRLTNPKHPISRKIAFVRQNTRRDRLLCRSVQSWLCKTSEAIENCLFADRKFHGWLINLRLIWAQCTEFSYRYKDHVSWKLPVIIIRIVSKDSHYTDPVENIQVRHCNIVFASVDRLLQRNLAIFKLTRRYQSAAAFVIAESFYFGHRKLILYLFWFCSVTKPPRLRCCTSTQAWTVWKWPTRTRSTCSM